MNETMNESMNEVEIDTGYRMYCTVILLLHA